MADKGKAITRLQPESLAKIQRGQVITASRLNDMATAIAKNTGAIRKPQQKDIAAEYQDFQYPWHP